jgi:hypothetical protein
MTCGGDEIAGHSAVPAVLCKQGVGGSSPLVSTRVAPAGGVATGTSGRPWAEARSPRTTTPGELPESLFATEGLAWFEAGG